MPKSIFKIPEAHANLPRNAFPLGNDELFTCPLGQLLPVTFREVYPNEHVEITPQLYARTMPLNSAAFVKIKQNVEFFFVPYRLLWSRAPQFFSRSDYPTSSLIPGSSPLYNPKVYMSVFANTIRNASVDVDFNPVDDLGFKWQFGAVRLLDYLGYGDFSPSLSSSSSSSLSRVTPNIFKILAYQKIYQDFYRNTVLEAPDIEAFNCDSVYESTIGAGSSASLFAVGQDNDSLLVKYLTIRYRNLRSDYFTSSRHNFTGAQWMTTPVSPVVFPQLDGSSSNGLNGVPVSGWLPDSTTVVDSAQGGIKMDTRYSSQTRNTVGFTIANLRSAYALDKLYDSMSRAKDGCYAHQMQARFGVTPELDDFHCRYLGGSDAPVQIGEVLGTASDNLGDIGGKGTAYNDGNTIKYDVKEHGIIMGILSFVPDNDYEADGLDRTNMKTSFSDYAQPEFSDLGYQPVYTFEIQSPVYNDLDNAVFGYNQRYAEYKTAYNRVHGLFRKGKSLSMWCSPLSIDDLANTGSLSINVNGLKINPKMLDTIMSVQFDGSEDSDQFICKCNFDYDIIRPFSRYGLPYTS